ncbi:MAG: hypothetical protein Q9163_004999 [Psora crenata]
MRGKSRVVVLSGAGISANAGIPFVRHISREMHISSYASNERTKTLHKTIQEIMLKAEEAPPTAFHNWLEKLARDGRLVRHYTQNFDCLEGKLPLLQAKTINLHGRGDQLICQSCSFICPMHLDEIPGHDLPGCPECEKRSLVRSEQGRRSLAIGRLRPHVLLYGEDHPNDRFIHVTMRSNLQREPDALLVVGRRLTVPGAKRMAKVISGRVKRRGGTSVWISKEGCSKDMDRYFSHKFQGNCDDAVESHRTE